MSAENPEISLVIPCFDEEGNLREPRATLEDLEDRRELARAKKRNGNKAGSNWESVKKEFGFKF